MILTHLNKKQLVKVYNRDLDKRCNPYKIIWKEANGYCYKQLSKLAVSKVLAEQELTKIKNIDPNAILVGGLEQDRSKFYVYVENMVEEEPKNLNLPIPENSAVNIHKKETKKQKLINAVKGGITDTEELLKITGYTRKSLACAISAYKDLF